SRGSRRDRCPLISRKSGILPEAPGPARETMKARSGILGQYKTGTTGVYSKILHSLPAREAVRTQFEPSPIVPEPADAGRTRPAKVMLRMREGRDDVDYSSFDGFTRRVRLVRDPRDWLVSGTLFVIQQNRAVYADDRVLEHVLGLLAAKE